ncbi:hypothetical protein J2Y44_001632 [Dyadobacter sp. BE32]|uniref:Uncharacterized protein n=1 Tax=Dyadobacter fermentans TaxID=94254 RepID=A0ABU1QTU0_9BACT|nr:hypothetical protein [Dyadobacter fermentans]MDR7214603.1 hypothetical protein [Dyadobacter sp. BE31]MDR7262138.1 hypothetical protein [Dyadobacter sp. BE32]
MIASLFTCRKSVSLTDMNTLHLKSLPHRQTGGTVETASIDDTGKILAAEIPRPTLPSAGREGRVEVFKCG